MLDIKFIREHSEFVKEAARKKHIDLDIEKFLKLDKDRQDLLQKGENLKQELKKGQEDFLRFEDAIAKEALQKKLILLSEQILVNEDILKKITNQLQINLLEVPNIPDMTVPEGISESENVEIKSVEENKNQEVPLKDLENIAEDFSLWYRDQDGARVYLESWSSLVKAIWRYTEDFWSDKGYGFLILPAIVNKNNLFASGVNHDLEKDYFKAENGQYLCNDSQAPFLKFLEKLSLEDLENKPKKYLVFGNYFSRVREKSMTKEASEMDYIFEQAIVSEASHQVSVSLHEELNKNIEEFLESLGLSYKTYVVCSGNLTLSEVKRYINKIYFPKQGEYKQISDSKYFHDFQTRRCGLKYVGKDGKTKFAHTLFSRVFSTKFLVEAILENFQNKEDEIVIPKVIQKYMGEKEKLIKSKTK